MLASTSAVFAPQAEDHDLGNRDAGVLMSASKPATTSIHTVPPFGAETSYYSGIADACITFAAASQHFQLTLNASPSRR